MNEVRNFVLVALAAVAVLALCEIADALSDLADSYCSLADSFTDAA